MANLGKKIQSLGIWPSAISGKKIQRSYFGLKNIIFKKQIDKIFGFLTFFWIFFPENALGQIPGLWIFFQDLPIEVKNKGNFEPDKFLRIGSFSFGQNSTISCIASSQENDLLFIGIDYPSGGGGEIVIFNPFLSIRLKRIRNAFKIFSENRVFRRIKHFGDTSLSDNHFEKYENAFKVCHVFQPKSFQFSIILVT